MATINRERNNDAFRQRIDHLIAGVESFLMWQTEKDSEGKVKRYISKLTFQQDLEDKSVLIFTAQDAVTLINSAIYMYSEDSDLIYKTSLNKLENNFIHINYPAELIFINELGDDEREIYQDIAQGLKNDYIQGRSYTDTIDSKPLVGRGRTEHIQTLIKKHDKLKSFNPADLSPELAIDQILTVDEEDQLFEDLRSSPRARPSNEQTVVLSPESRLDKARYMLFDLSTGGLSFKTDNGAKFIIDQRIKVYTVGDNQIKPPRVGRIASKRRIDDTNEYKIGVQFLLD